MTHEHELKGRNWGRRGVQGGGEYGGGDGKTVIV